MTTIAVVVDVQRDFCEGGAMGVPGGNAVAGGIAEWLGSTTYDLVIACRDTHLPPPDTNGGHFAADGQAPDWRTTWVPHCVQGTPGADYHPRLAGALPTDTVHVTKGAGRPAYSALEAATAEGQPLAGWLSARFADRADLSVHVMGVATDYCVRQTVLDLRRELPGARVTVLAWLCVGVDRQASAAALAEMAASGALIVRDPVLD